ncbi:MAG: hypothetical protein RMJ05_09975 [Thermomicrobium sp.]|nr:hypothetical protein [Thermomicrobium sp.]MDW8007034.1 hypothetical protein [Thermomicrobium sp.]
MAERIVRIDGYLEALSPIVHHGDEKTGSTPVLRSVAWYVPDDDTFVDLPFLSGNAVRGVLRRLAFHDLLDTLGYTVESPKLHHALFTGGVLESTDETTGVIDLAFRKHVRDAIPPLALFGTSIGNQMVPGSLRVDLALPYCRETAHVIGGDDPRLRHDARQFCSFVFATRRDDLRAEREEDEQAVQMLVEFEAFVPGTRFDHGFTLVYPSDLEVSCLGHVLHLWEQQPFIGGKAGSGFGRIALHYEPWPDPEPYRRYVAEQRERIVAALDEMAKRLGG